MLILIFKNKKAGVEYYESIKSEKYLIFKKKMQSLWIKPNVIEAMNRAAAVNQKEKAPTIIKV